jgi:hypothetical protein
VSHAFVDILSVLSALCWPVCFWWMHRISVKQNTLLARLRKETEEVRKISEAEHELVQKIEPKVAEVAEKLT